jgi:hypothetical protein
MHALTTRLAWHSFAESRFMMIPYPRRQPGHHPGDDARSNESASTMGGLLGAGSVDYRSPLLSNDAESGQSRCSRHRVAAA